jgi:hypothetical protein
MRFVPRYNGAALGFTDGSGIDAYYKGNGTTGLTDLRFNTSNTERMRIDENGEVGIGSFSFNASNPEQLLVDAGTGTTNFQNVIVGKGNTNSYAQLNIQNTNSGTAASSDVVATANNGSESGNYIDMGINGGSNTSSGVLGGANTAYLYSTGADLVIGNSTASKDISIYTTPAVGSSAERMTITSSGNVGVNASSPVSTLDVNGSTGAAINVVSSNITLDATHYTVILTSGTPIVTLPSAASSTRRMYIIVNHTGTARTISTYKNYSNANTTTIAANSSITIQSDGTNWYQIQ